MRLVALIFWLGIVLVAYAYAGYGALVGLLAWLRPRPPRAAAVTPSMTLVIPCYNEASWIAAKIEGSLALDYPADRLEILVVVSGSDDGTEEIVASYAPYGVRCLVQPTRAGKEAAMCDAAAVATGDILVFTDANACLNPGALRALARWFADPSVGCVSGEKRVRSGEDTRSGRGEGLYWRYESALKRLDSLVGSTMGAAGELIADRAPLARFPETDNIIEDFVLSMRVVEAGFRVVYEPEAVAVEDANARIQDLFERRARIAAGGLQALWRLRALLDPRRGVTWWQYVSHRALRWAVVPFTLPALLVLNGRLARGSAPYTALFAGQLAFYAAAAIGWRRAHTDGSRNPLFYYPFFFTAANAAVIAGFARLVTGKQSVLWRKTRS
jgi:cellulose synthase/poly-beta-1,6-N-acetylglucosamine synthase-like glycosyltransferase